MGWLDGVARRGARRGQTGVPRWGARRGQTECPTGLDGVPNGAGWGARQVARRCGQTGCLTGGETGWPDGVLDGAKRVPRHFLNATSSATSFFDCHVIGHVIFECHVTRLGWQGVILLPILVSQR
jgi:hypothetical protein